MLSPKTFSFLKELKKNNNRDWFNDHKADYLAVKDEFESLVEETIGRIGKFDKDIADLSPRDCIFRIYKDIRFAKDKSPYKTHMGAWMVKDGKKAESGAGYYVHIEPKGSFLAGGAHMPDSVWLKALRNHVYKNWKEFEKIRRNGRFKKIFEEMEGEKLKRLPSGFDPDHPAAEMLKLKSYVVVHRFNETTALSNSFGKYCGDVFRVLHPLNRFLNATLK